MAWDARAWRRALVLAAFSCFALGTAAWTQFTPFTDRSRAMLEGNWQSCRGADGEYEERVYDGRWSGVPPFELHLGPYHDFALFQGIQDDHRDHGSADNLLRPHTVELRSNRGSHQWDVAGLHLEVALSGGSHEECESWFVRLSPQTSSH
jgi:hypothetical protein